MLVSARRSRADLFKDKHTPKCKRGFCVILEKEHIKTLPMSRIRYVRWDKIKKKFVPVQEIAVVLETIIDLERIARNNVKKMLPCDTRWDGMIEKEIIRIIELDMAKYFCIVRRISVFLKEKDKSPRFFGNGGCSLVAYLLGITDINPYEYGLIFERYFNEKYNLQSLFGFYMDEDTLDELVEYLKKDFEFVEIEIVEREYILHIDKVEISIITSADAMKEVRDWIFDRFCYLGTTPYTEDYMHFIHYTVGYSYDEVEKIRRIICSFKKNEIDALEAQFIMRCPQWIACAERFALFYKIARGMRMSISKAYCVSALKVLGCKEIDCDEMPFGGEHDDEK